jgi:hypothetical protein
MFGTRPELNAKIKESQQRGFSEWLDQPLVKLSVSQVPEGNRRDEFRVLLQSAFDAGHAAGQACVLMSFIEEMVKHRGRP